MIKTVELREQVRSLSWLKKWCFLVLLIGMGSVYLACVDDGEVLARPGAAVRGWLDGLASGNKGTGDGEKERCLPEGEENYLAGGSAAIALKRLSEARTEGAGNRLSGPGGNGSGMRPSVSGGDSMEPWLPENVPGGSDLLQTSDETEEGDGTNTGDGFSGADAPEGGEADEGTSGENEPGENGISYMTVEDDYFADAVFIGDSRTVGMCEYGGLEGISTFYASTGLSVHKLFTSKIVPVQGQKKKITVEEALQQNTFSKIYFMIGINEMGTGTVDTFMEKYASAVAHLQELQPDAVIYLQGIMKVTAKRSAQGDYITNEGIEERNWRIAQLADNEKIFYLDVNEAVCDDTGGMAEDYTHDGVHLKAKYIELWKQFLKEHAVAQRLN